MRGVGALFSRVQDDPFVCFRLKFALLNVEPGNAASCINLSAASFFCCLSESKPSKVNTATDEPMIWPRRIHAGQTCKPGFMQVIYGSLWF